MKHGTRRSLMGLLIATTCIWALITILVFVASNSIPELWLLATIVLYAVTFTVALLLLWLASPEAAAVPSPTPKVPLGPAQERVFVTRRGAVELERRNGGVAEVVVAEPGQPVPLDVAEGLLDRLQPASGEGAPPSTYPTDRPIERRPEPVRPKSSPGVPA